MKPNAVMIETVENRITVRAPYNPAFIAASRNFGGRWNRDAGAWTFDLRVEDLVRATARTLYGTDAIDYDPVTARIDAGTWWRHDPTGDDSTCYFAGRKILWRRGRDCRVELGAGVVLVDGKFEASGGSVRNPSLDIDHGTIVEVYDVPSGHPDLDHPCVTTAAKPADNPAPVDTQALLIERERLTARLAEINAILDNEMLHVVIDALSVADE